MAQKLKNSSINRYNAAATFQSGKVGNIRYYTKGNRSYVRAAYNSTRTNPRTDAQMKQRLKWANMSDTWHVLKDWLQKGFEGSTPFRSTYNLFMKANQGNGIYLTKEESYRDLTKLQPMVVSAGSIDTVTQAIEIVGGSDYFVKTALHVGALPFATLGELSTLLINNGLQDGDQITLLAVAEILPIGGGSGNLGRLKAACKCIVLDTADTTPIGELPISLAKDSDLNLLFRFGSVGQKIAGAVIISRKTDSGLKVSREELVLSPECDYATWLDEAHFRRAVESYGPAESVYLDPESHQEFSNIPTPPPAASYTLTLAVAQGQQAYGTVEGAGTYNVNTQVTFQAVPNEGYHFVEWSDGNTNAQRTITMTENVSLVATFELDAPSSKVTITVTKTGSGAGTGVVEGAGEYNVGDTVTLEALDEGGAYFNEWTRNGVTIEDNPLTFVATTDETITADFGKSL